MKIGKLNWIGLDWIRLGRGGLGWVGLYHFASSAILYVFIGSYWLFWIDREKVLDVDGRFAFLFCFFICFLLCMPSCSWYIPINRLHASME